MKICPSCKTQYTDDTLTFCLQDGTRLVSPESDMPTVAFNETETVVSGRDRDSEVTSWLQSEVTRISTPDAKRSNAVWVILLTAIVMLGGIAILSIGAWLYFRDSGGEVVTNGGNKIANNTDGNQSNSQTLPTPTATVKPSPNPSGITVNIPVTNSSTPPIIDRTQISRDVSQRIYAWKSQAESHDLNAYMRNYADTVNYYRRSGASAAFVRSDKQRAFTMFSVININISSVSVSVDASGETATAVFDKEWVFDGRRRSSGKVRSQLKFKNINGSWLITGEKDLKVYYLN